MFCVPLYGAENFLAKSRVEIHSYFFDFHFKVLTGFHFKVLPVFKKERKNYHFNLFIVSLHVSESGLLGSC